MWKKKTQRASVTFNAEKILLAASQPLAAVYSFFQTTPLGLNGDEVEERQALYGKNEVEHERRKSRYPRLSKPLSIPLSVY